MRRSKRTWIWLILLAIIAAAALSAGLFIEDKGVLLSMKRLSLVLFCLFATITVVVVVSSRSLSPETLLSLIICAVMIAVLSSDVCKAGRRPETAAPPSGSADAAVKRMVIEKDAPFEAFLYEGHEYLFRSNGVGPYSPSASFIHSASCLCGRGRRHETLSVEEYRVTSLDEDLGLFRVDYNGHAYFVSLYSPDILHIPSCPCRQASPAASGTERP